MSVVSGRPLNAIALNSCAVTTKSHGTGAGSFGQLALGAPMSKDMQVDAVMRTTDGAAVENQQPDEDGSVPLSNNQQRPSFVVRRKSSTNGDAVPLPTFADISSRAGMADKPGAHRPNLLDSLKNIGNLALARAAGGGATVSAPLGSSSAGVAAGVAAADTRELTGTSMPYDWVLKRCVRLFSNQMLQDAGILHRLPPQQGALAHDAFLRGADVASSSAAATMSRPAQLLAALLSWRFPDALWSGETMRALVGALPAQRAGAGADAAAPTAGPSGLRGGVTCVLGLRLSAWREALRSAYVQLRAGVCPAFYMIFHGQKPYSILFCGRGVRGMAAPHALVSQSSGGMRTRLAAAGVPFVLPLSPAAADEAVRAAAAKLRRVGDGETELGNEPGSVGMGARAPWTSARDHSPESMLLVLGPVAVHGLVDVLLSEVNFQEQTWLGREPADLPTLLAPVSFDGATPRAPAVRVHGGTLAARSLGADVAPRAGGCACVEVEGPVPPWTLRRVVALMQNTAQSSSAAGAAHAQLEADPACLALNVCAAAPAPAGGYKAADDADAATPPGCLSADDARALRAIVPELHARNVKTVEVRPQASEPLTLRLS